jgi:hypothetical protein
MKIINCPEVLKKEIPREQFWHRLLIRICTLPRCAGEIAVDQDRSTCMENNGMNGTSLARLGPFQNVEAILAASRAINRDAVAWSAHARWLVWSPASRRERASAAAGAA